MDPVLSVPFLIISLPWESFLLVAAHSALLLLVGGLKGRSLYSALFERWLWPVPAFFCSFMLLSALKKRLIDPNYFAVLVLISAFQKGVFYKGCPCYIYQNYFSLLHLNLFFIAHPSSKTLFLWTICGEVQGDVMPNSISTVSCEQEL